MIGIGKGTMIGIRDVIGIGKGTMIGIRDVIGIGKGTMIGIRDVIGIGKGMLSNHINLGALALLHLKTWNLTFP